MDERTVSREALDLEEVLEQIDEGELMASKAERAYIAGALQVARLRMTENYGNRTT